MSYIKKMIITALLIAIGIVLSLVFHLLQFAGPVFLPMHIPILICGLICGIPFGLAAGVITPLLSHLIVGMPPAFILPAMILELAAYGVVAAVLMRYLPIKNLYAKSYISLIGAMLIGRVFFGVLNALIFSVGEYSMQMWLTAAFIAALPGIIIQLVIIPSIVVALQKARLVEVKQRSKKAA